MFGDDFLGGGIEDLFNRLSGQGLVESSTVGPDGKRRTTRRMQKDVFGKALLDKVTTKKKLFFVFDFSGKTDVYADIKDELVQNDYGEEVATGKKVLEVKEGNEVASKFPLSENIRTKGFESNFNNGILEVSFKR